MNSDSFGRAAYNGRMEHPRPDTIPDTAAAVQKPRGFLGRIFRRCAACAGSGTGGFLIGHAGCILTPLALAGVGITGAAVSTPALAVAFGAAATAGGLYLWQKMRGADATPFERRAVTGGMLAGFAFSIGLHLGDPHGHLAHANHVMTPEAAALYETMSPAQRAQFAENARALNMTLAEYLGDLCAPRPPQPAPVP